MQIVFSLQDGSLASSNVLVFVMKFWFTQSIDHIALCSEYNAESASYLRATLYASYYIYWFLCQKQKICKLSSIKKHHRLQKIGETT